jgi:transcriptional regulator with XRE-family HTH domain
MNSAGEDQSSLARSIGITQGAISKILQGKTANSRHLPRIAFHLGVPLDWLLGEIDTLECKKVRPSAPTVQHITMQVALPSENALAEMYAAQLQAFARLEGDELARALARRLPKALAQLQAAELYEQSDNSRDGHAEPEHLSLGRRESQQARRT